MSGGLRGSTRAVAPARFPCFDGLRAIAALTVVGVHFSSQSGLTSRRGYGAFHHLAVGIAIFFVISGFLLYRPFAVAHLSKLPPPRYGVFMKRRLLRIFPAYWAALTILTLLGGGGTQFSGWGIPVYYGLVHIYVPGYEFGGIAQSWTLCVEMSFYLLLPAYAWLVGHRRRMPGDQLRVEVLGLVLLYLSAFAFLATTGLARLWEGRPMQLWLPAHVDLFALGMLLAVASAWLAGRPNRLADRVARPLMAAASWGVAGLAFWMLVTRVHTPPTTSVEAVAEIELFYGLIAFFLVLPAVIGAAEGGLVRQFLRSRPMQLMGLISFGIYLWHLKAIALVFQATGGRLMVLGWVWPHGAPPYVPLFLVSLLVTLALATLSYVVIERRFLRLKDRTLWPRPAVSLPKPALKEP